LWNCEGIVSIGENWLLSRLFQIIGVTCIKSITRTTMNSIRISLLQLLVLAFLINCSPASAQILNWVNSFGSTSGDNGRAIAVDSDGNIFIAGVFSGTVDFDPGPGTTELTRISGNGLFFGMYDKYGGLVWIKQFDDLGINWCYPTHVALDNSENLVILGKFHGTMDFDPGPGVTSYTAGGTSDDIFITKFERDGDFIWAKHLGGNYTKNNNGIDFDKDNNIILSGKFQQKVDFDIGTGHDTLTSTGLDNMYLAKYNPSGGYLWAFNIGGDGWNDGSYAHAVDTSSNIYITGLFSNICDFDPGPGNHELNSNNGRVFFACYDKDGNFEWVMQTPGDPIRNMVISQDQTIYLGGEFQGMMVPDFHGGDQLNSIEASDIFVALFETDGTFLKKIHLGGPGEDHISDMVLDRFYNIYIDGNFQDSIMVNGIYPESDTSNGIDNIFIAKVNPSDEMVWFANFETENFTMQEDIIREIFVNEKGYVYAIGEYTDSLEFDPDTSSTLLHTAGGSDCFFAKYSQLPEIVIQPESAEACELDTISFPVHMKGSAPMDYAWEVGIVGTWSSANDPMYSGALTEELTIHSVPVSADGYQYRVIASNEFGSDTAESFALTVNPLPLIDFGQDSSICFGDSVILDAGEGYDYVWDDASTFRYLVVEETGLHFAVITDVYGCKNADTILVTVNDNPTVNITASATEICPGEVIDLDGNPTNLEGGDGLFEHEWTGDISYLSDAGIVDPKFASITPASYQLIYQATDENGCSDQDTIALVVNPLPPQVHLGNDTVFCGDQSTVLRAGPGFHSYLWQDGSDGDTLYVDTTGTYAVRAFNEFGCETKDTADIRLQYPYNQEVICLVTVDRKTGKILVIWEKTPDVGTAYYNIYRESSIFGKYDSIGTSPYDDLSVFTDETANLESQQYLYKISVVDTCGLESDKSPFHKSLFLQYVSSTGGVNLEWSEYEVEGGTMNFETYELYRGTDSTDLHKLTEVSSSLDRYTDKDPLALTARYYYRIAGRMPDSCRPSGGSTKADAGPYSHSMSNIEDNRLQSGIRIQEIVSTGLIIYPNPFNQTTVIEFPNPEKNAFKMYITNLAGKVVRFQDNIFTNQVELHRKNLPTGVYFVELQGDRIYRGKLVIE
jgi:hypothetical protein